MVRLVPATIIEEAGELAVVLREVLELAPLPSARVALDLASETLAVAFAPGTAVASVPVTYWTDPSVLEVLLSVEVLAPLSMKKGIVMAAIAAITVATPTSCFLYLSGENFIDLGNLILFDDRRWRSGVSSRLRSDDHSGEPESAQSWYIVEAINPAAVYRD